MYTIHGYRPFTKETVEETIEAFENLGVMIERVGPFYDISIGHYPHQTRYKMVKDFDEAVCIANRILDGEEGELAYKLFYCGDEV